MLAVIYQSVVSFLVLFIDFSSLYSLHTIFFTATSLYLHWVDWYESISKQRYPWRSMRPIQISMTNRYWILFYMHLERRRKAGRPTNVCLFSNSSAPIRFGNVQCLRSVNRDILSLFVPLIVGVKASLCWSTMWKDKFHSCQPARLRTTPNPICLHRVSAHASS